MEKEYKCSKIHCKSLYGALLKLCFIIVGIASNLSQKSGFIAKEKII